jgi:hypothetical protein
MSPAFTPMSHGRWSCPPPGSKPDKSGGAESRPVVLCFVWCLHLVVAELRPAMCECVCACATVCECVQLTVLTETHQLPGWLPHHKSS